MKYWTILLLSLVCLTPRAALAQKVACANDFTSCTNGVISLPAGSTAANPTATAGPTAINGVATTYLRSDGAPAIQLGSSSVKGIVQVDGTTITASSGVISCPTGTPSAIGCMGIDNTSIGILSGFIGVIRPFYGNAANGASGWFEMPAHWFMEFGTATSSGTSSGNVTITLPHSLTTGVVSLTGTPASSGKGVSADSCTTTTCTMTLFDTTTAAGVSGVAVFYTLMGY